MEDVKLIVSYRRRYAGGYKYCARCRAFYLTDAVRCLVCGILLRSSPRKKRAKERELRAVDAGMYLSRPSILGKLRKPSS